MFRRKLAIMHRVPTSIRHHEMTMHGGRTTTFTITIVHWHLFSEFDLFVTYRDFWELSYHVSSLFSLIAFYHIVYALARRLCSGRSSRQAPTRVLVQAASTFQFDIEDPSRTCLNPSPPDNSSLDIRFPTVLRTLNSLNHKFITNQCNHSNRCPTTISMHNKPCIAPLPRSYTTPDIVLEPKHSMPVPAASSRCRWDDVLMQHQYSA